MADKTKIDPISIDLRISKEKAALKEFAKEDLEKQEYFHGFRPRKDLQHLLKEPNDFLVRATDSNGDGSSAELVVSVLNDRKELLHLTLRLVLFVLIYVNSNEGGLWQFSLTLNAYKNRRKKSSRSDDLTHKNKKIPIGFGSVVELINYYKDHKTPGRAYLKKAILRPAWLITHDKVEYKTSDLVGSGNFCHVYKGKYYRTPTDIYDVAVKVCHEGKLASETNDESKQARKAMISEAQTMSNYVHEFIITLHGVAMAHPPILIVMEFCAGGNLEYHLKKCGDKIEAGERVIYALEAARGMRYLHEQGCVHRDLAARNCLISSKGTIKISDFGLSKMTSEKSNKDEEPETSPQIPVRLAFKLFQSKEFRWMAPESLKKPMVFSAKTDVWSFGVLLYELFNNGVKPWPDEPVKKIATMIRKCQMPTFPEKAPNDIKEMVKLIWIADAAERPTMGRLYRDLCKIRKVVLPPADTAMWAVNTIPGVKRPSVDMGAIQDDISFETKSNDASLPTVETTNQSDPGLNKRNQSD